MKLSDYVAHFLADQGIRHVFAICGGASLHLIHSVDNTPGIDFVCPQTEQMAAMAADAYARVSGGLGAAIATSGPGATNLLTGVCSAYYDSVPTIFVTGQVSTFRLRGDQAVRQIGFQETSTIEIFRSVTKYAVQVCDPQRIRYELEKAVHLAKSGRPGPVLIDIPDNVQREQIKPNELDGYLPEPTAEPSAVSNEQLDRCVQMLAEAARPVIVVGWGVHLARAEPEIRQFVDRLGFPVAPTWGAADLFPHDHPLLIGTFGTHGRRDANLAIQNADLIISIGSRLDTKATGSPADTFAREAKKIVIDIDTAELRKFEKYGLRIDLSIAAHAKDFLRQIMPRLPRTPEDGIASWRERILGWQSLYPVCPDSYYAQRDVNPYVFVKQLSRAAAEDDLIIVDTGCGLAWMMQAFEFKQGQRLFHDFNNTAMGWALPASIGASFARPARRVLCVVGDGSLQMSIQELATIVRHQLPVKLFVLNNHGYSMIQQTQDQWLSSDYLASSIEGGLALPDFPKVAASFGLPTASSDENRGLASSIQTALAHQGPFFCNIEIRPEHRVVPQVKFGRPNEDPEPLLKRPEFLKQMIVKPLEVSLTDSSPL